MAGEAGGSVFDYVELLVQNVSLWPLMVLVVLVWLARRPSRFSPPP